MLDIFPDFVAVTPVADSMLHSLQFLFSFSEIVQSEVIVVCFFSLRLVFGSSDKISRACQR